jgi:hypothetical protein
VEPYLHHRILNGVDTLYQTINTEMEYLRDYMEDYVTPHFKEQIASGVIINNPMTHVVTHRWTDGSYQYHAKSKSQDLAYYGMNGSKSVAAGGVHILMPSSPLENAKASAQTSALNNMDKTPASMLEDVLEIRASMRLLRHPITSVLGETYKMGKLYRRYLNTPPMQRVHKRRLKERLDSAYLAYRFGISPMMRSIDTLVNIDMLKQAANRDTRRTAKGYATIPLSQNSDIYSNGTWQFQRHVMLEGSVRATVIYEDFNPIDGWRTTYGLRNKDIPLGLWNIVPLSFMVDRVYNASKQIGALSNLSDPHVKILAGTYTVRSQSVRSFRVIKQLNTAYWIKCNGDTVYESIDSKNRYVWTPSALDTFQGVTPENLVKDASSTSDLLALLGQRLKGLDMLRKQVIQKR